jgi:hypothetical protein
MLENLQQSGAFKKATGHMADFPMRTVQLKAIIALLLALALIPSLSGVALIA